MKQKIKKFLITLVLMLFAVYLFAFLIPSFGDQVLFAICLLGALYNANQD